MTALELTKIAVKALDDKKANNIQVIKVDNLTIVAEYFVIASTDNTTHVKALADEVEFKAKESGAMPQHIEGYQAANWIILDYADVLVHVFHEETRGVYDLEKLWAQGEKMDVEQLLK